MKLDRGGFPAVRSGPGSGYRQVGELHDGRRVTIFGGRGSWLGVKVPGGRIDRADACGRGGRGRQLSGPGLGRVHGRRIGDTSP
ncbi:SH3 domain-containing protein [Paracoccus sp. (in: a-proteobacteria)]|uniref:SH3 domain-containing protein n=1 Tax=Paracoccus sp. TaxID=267 RepID=UPI0034CD7C33